MSISTKAADDSPAALLDADKASARQAQVLDAAARCFQTCGFHGTSIQRISEAAGMSPGHIYHYFRNKEAIVAGIVGRNLGELLERVAALRRAGERMGVVQACVAEVDAAIALRSVPGSVSLGLEILAEATRNAEITGLVRQADQQVRQSTRALILQLPALGRLAPEDLEARLTVMYTLFDGLMVRTLLQPDIDRRATGKVIQRMVRVLLEDDGQA